MKPDNPTIMLGLSFYKNSDQVLETLETFSPRMVTTPYRLILGLENELPEAGIPKMTRGASLFEELRKQGWDACYLWDDELNRIGMSILQDTPVRPFYGNFSYGAAVNRLMLLADIAGAAALVRIDPGTGGSSNFDKLLKCHLDIIGNNPGCVVSGQYSRRQAIRDEFVSPENRQYFYELIRKYTGINPAPGCQLTGGAAFTMTAESLPAVPFDGVKVWGSDDGFFQVLHPEQAIVQTVYPVDRAEAGFGLNITAYLERVANMAVLKALHDGTSVLDGYGEATLFVDEMERVLAPGQGFDREKCLARVKNVLQLIAQGHVNYNELKRHWRDLQRTMAERIPAGAAVMFAENNR